MRCKQHKGAAGRDGDEEQKQVNNIRVGEGGRGRERERPNQDGFKHCAVVCVGNMFQKCVCSPGFRMLARDIVVHYCKSFSNAGRMVMNSRDSWTKMHTEKLAPAGHKTTFGGKGFSRYLSCHVPHQQ